MVNGINSPKNINFINPNQNNNQVKNEEEKTKQTESLPSNVTADYNVSVPKSYTKIGVQKLPNGQEIHCYKLANGQKVFIAPMKSPMAYVNTYVKTGSMNEKDSERGISHFTEHMAFNGTTGTDGYEKLGVGDVFRKVGELGGYTNASTGFAETNYTIGVPQFDNKELEKAISIQSSMMNNLEMSDKMVDKEHGPVSSEIVMYSDNPGNRTENVALKALYNIQTTSDDLVAGRVDNIQNIDKNKVTAYYKNNYYPANMSTVITGNVNPDEAIGLVSKYFHSDNIKNPDRKSEPLKPIDKTVRTDFISDKAVATNGTIAFNGPANNDLKEQQALRCAAYFLFMKANSAVKKPLEQINTTADFGSQKISTVPTDGQVVTIGYKSDEANSEEALKSIFTNIKNFKTPTDEDMKIAKTALKSQNQDKVEDPSELNLQIGSSSLDFDVSDFANKEAIIDSLTGQDIKNAIDKYLNVDKASIAISHPKGATQESISANHKKANETLAPTAVAFKGLEQINSQPQKTGTNTVEQSKINDNKQILPIDKSKIINYKMNNNYEAVLSDTPQNSNAKFNLVYQSTSPIMAKPAVKEALVHMLNVGTMSKDENTMNQMSDNNNIKSNIASWDGNQLSFNGSVPSENASNYIDLLKEQVTSPRFTEKELEKTKKQIKAMCNNTETSSKDAFDKEVYTNSQLAYSTKDIADNIDNVTLKDVSDLYQNIMQNSSATIAVAAPLSDRKVINAVNKLSQMPSVKQKNPQYMNIYKPNEKSVVRTEVLPHSQADIMQGYKFKVSGNIKDNTTFDLMTIILSNGDTTGLFNNLREKEKLAYAVNAQYGSTEDIGNITCSILTTTDDKGTGQKSYDNIQKSINGFNRQINKMKNGEYTDKELEVAKKIMKKELLDSSYSQEGISRATSFGLGTPYGADYANKKYEMIDNITRADITAAANYAFSNKPIYSITATKDTLDANKEFLNSINNK